MPHPLLIGVLGGYALLHSLLASQPCKTWVQRRWGRYAMRWYRLVYNIIAAVTLVPLLFLLAVLPDTVLYRVSAPWNWLLLAGQALALLGMVNAVAQTGTAHFLGLVQLRTVSTDEPGSFVESGSYGYVRHPIYTFALLMMWLSPLMTVNWFTVYCIFSVYMYAATFHEEYRLVQEFGDTYRSYQRRVGRLFPRWHQLIKKGMT